MNAHDTMMNLRLKNKGDDYDHIIDTIPMDYMLQQAVHAYFNLQAVALDLTSLDTLRIHQLEDSLGNFKQQVFVLQKRMYNIKKGLRDE